MRPSDALQQDWRLYYDQSWMYHTTLGPGLVRVHGAGLYFYRFPDDVIEPEATKVRATDLGCWWPRSGAFNTSMGAVYIARKTTRSMRKSAHPSEHYKVRWGQAYAFKSSTHNLMLLLRRGPSLVDSDFARKAIRTGMTNSVAVTPDVILAKTSVPEELSVIFRGIPVGILTEDEDFEPSFARDALSRRVKEKLEQEHII
jgi:hypothetical protein